MPKPSNTTTSTTSTTSTNKRPPPLSTTNTGSQSQTTLVLSRPKAHPKKRPTAGLPRTHTNLSLHSNNKQPTLLLPANRKQNKQPRKRAFQGALDADPDVSEQEEEEEEDDEDAWTSKPSTRATSPIQHPHNNSHHQQQQQQQETSTDHQQQQQQQLALPASLQLQLQLPNPLPSPTPHLPPQEPLQPLPHEETSPAQSDDSDSRDHLNQPIESHALNTTLQPENASPHPLIPPAASTRMSVDNTSNDQHNNKGKERASSSGGKRSSMHSIRSLSSLVMLHHDSTQLARPTPPSRLALKRVDSSASMVLPPKMDPTEAVISLNGKATFNPTLMSISDFPCEMMVTPHLAPITSSSSKPTATTTATAVCIDTSHSPLPHPIHPPSSSSTHRLSSSRPPSPSSGRSTLNHHHSTREEPSECAQRLKKYSHHLGRPGPHLNNLKTANEGLLSALLSPGLTFSKSRRPSDPNTPQQQHPSGPGGYFDSWKKSLVGLSSLAEEATAPAPGHEEDPPTMPPQPVRLAGLGDAVAAAPARRGSSKDTSGLPNTKDAASRSAYRRPHKLPTAHPKPAVPGFITTCGSVPVVSKFLGPRAAATPVPPVALAPVEVGPSSSSTNSPREAARSADPVAASTPRITTPTMTATTTMGRKTGSEAGGGGGTLGRIQKKLLMERDRPISPTLFDDASPPSPAGPSSSSSAAAPLPPPSYLIRSLGGQTGPLPFIPLNLLPPDSAAPAATVAPAALPAAFLVPLPAPRSDSQNNPSPSHASPFPAKLDPRIHPQRLNQPALKAKQALEVKRWRNSLIDEVEQVLTDHESNTRFRNPLFESLLRVSSSSSSSPSRAPPPPR
ncbi:hypothetical protein PCANC_10267 [Puccinia coronata f. sp. avenae]|uniref:Uncharacterized protein n=1 Tax=Puccinia coronata f. sp. avenae TaxID=200324 RepID=A0A2N5VQB7_9BASI|nr:hypothetical protein PCANC_10267 [Puccinia coronata f. sp. avenae]